VDARIVVVGFGPYRGALEAMASPRTLFTGPLEHRHLVHLLPLADVTVVPSIFPEAFGMVAAEAAAAGSPPLVARHSGLAEVAAGLEEHYPKEYRHLASFDNGNAHDLAAKLAELLGLPAEVRAALGAAAPKAGAAGTELDEHLVGELIASEIEVKTGRCSEFAEAAERMARRRVQLAELADQFGVGLAATGTHPWSRWQDQRIIDTPHYRRNN